MAQMKYFYELTISSSPHAHSPITTRTIMRDVLIALVPALLADGDRRQRGGLRLLRVAVLQAHEEALQDL